MVKFVFGFFQVKVTEKPELFFTRSRTGLLLRSDDITVICDFGVLSPSPADVAAATYNQITFLYFSSYIILTLSTLSNFNGLFHSLFWKELKWSVS